MLCSTVLSNAGEPPLRVVVTGGDLTRRRDGEVEAEGIGRRRSRARALLSCEMCAAAQEGVEGEARD